MPFLCCWFFFLFLFFSFTFYSVFVSSMLSISRQSLSRKKEKRKRRRRIKTRQVTVPHVDAELSPWRSDRIGHNSRRRFRDRRLEASDWLKTFRSGVSFSVGSVRGDEQIFIIFLRLNNNTDTFFALFRLRRFYPTFLV